MYNTTILTCNFFRGDWVTTEQAEAYVVKEMGVSQEVAQEFVATTNKNDDGKVSNQELVDLWNKMQDA